MWTRWNAALPDDGLGRAQRSPTRGGRAVRQSLSRNRESDGRLNQDAAEFRGLIRLLVFGAAPATLKRFISRCTAASVCVPGLPALALPARAVNGLGL